jgi:hypothetical protein
MVIGIIGAGISTLLIGGLYSALYNNLSNLSNLKKVLLPADDM